MARDRDVAAFGKRAHGYDEGGRGRLHHQIADRTAGLALACAPAPRRILDVGCGTGYLLGRLAAWAPQAEVLALRGLCGEGSCVVSRVAHADSSARGCCACDCADWRSGPDGVNGGVVADVNGAAGDKGPECETDRALPYRGAVAGVQRYQIAVGAGGVDPAVGCCGRG